MHYAANALLVAGQLTICPCYRTSKRAKVGEYDIDDPVAMKERKKQEAAEARELKKALAAEEKEKKKLLRYDFLQHSIWMWLTDGKAS